jgi:hypothetical protein
VANQSAAFTVLNRLWDVRFQPAGVVHRLGTPDQKDDVEALMDLVMKFGASDLTAAGCYAMNVGDLVSYLMRS